MENTNKKTKHKSELLMPAGNLERLKVAVTYGADAIYMGTPDMSLRTKSQLTLEDVIEGIEFAHSHGVRVYLTLNLFAHNKDVPKLDEYLETVRKVKPDGLIIADPGVFNYVKKEFPDLPLHISTQANVCSYLTVDYWKEQGAELVVLAREVTYEELKEIREKCPDVRLEAFVHGSMCMTYSGRCMLSNFMSERGANQGNCTNSCRWNYKLHIKMKDGTVKELNINEDNKDMFEFFLEESCRPGDMMEILEDERGSYILNSRDLCLLPKLPELLSIGIDSLKVEGRGKSPFYVAAIARAYRMAMDDWYKDAENWNPKQYMDEVLTVPSRGYTHAFHEGRLTHLSHGYEDTESLSDYEFSGIVEEIRDDAFIVRVKNRLDAGDVIEFIPPKRRDTILLRMYEFEDAESGDYQNKYDMVVGSKRPLIRIPFSLFDHENIEQLKKDIPVYTVIRSERSLTPAQWERLKLDKIVNNIEIGRGGTIEQYNEQVLKLVDEKSKNEKEKQPKFLRMGKEGCCGRGCNGCSIFWNDPKYAKAREKLAKKKQGEMLDKDISGEE